MPTNPSPGQVVNIPISQLVQANGADRFDLQLRVPILQGSARYNAYLYQVHLYLTYNVNTKPLDLGVLLVDLPLPPSAGEYYWDSYDSTHPQVIAGMVYTPDMPRYKKCVINNSYALRSLLSSSAKRPAALATILPQLRY
jgi:hypothetical protein